MIGQERIETAWRFVWDRLYSEHTELIYDHVPDDLSYFPTREDDESIS